MDLGFLAGFLLEESYLRASQNLQVSKIEAKTECQLSFFVLPLFIHTGFES
jgi:hypothetical protein